MSAPTPTEFANAEGYYTHDAGGLLFGVEPAMLVCALLILLAVAALAYLLGARRFSGDRGSDEATDAIHARILRASQAALSADSNQLKHKAEELVALVGKLLGPVIKVGSGVGSPLKLLDEALKGKIKVPATHEHAPAAHDKPHDPPRASAGAGAGNGGGGAAASSHVTIISLPFQGVSHAEHSAPADLAHPPAAAHTPAHSPAPEETRDMTVEEQTDALARAVRKFNDHWSRSDARKTELREARIALSNPPKPLAIIGIRA